MSPATSTARSSTKRALSAAGDTKPLLTVGEAATRIGVHANTLRSYTAAGLVPYLRLPGGQRRYRPADIDHFVEGLARPDIDLSENELAKAREREGF